MKTLLLTLALVLACSEKEDEDTGKATDGGASDGGGEDGGVEECEDVPPESCDGTAGCAALSAWPVSSAGSGWCVDFGAERVALGCMDDDLGCGAAETPATTEDRPDECLWLFPSTCLPPGYVSCPASSLDECP